MAAGENARSVGRGRCSGARRLRDGFYEQKLVRDQVLALTGQRFLGNYQSDEQQYQALMDSGLTFAKAMNLRPGIALSAEQMAQLTSDMVWLVSKEVTLADGSKQNVLVPQVYARVQPGDVDGTGALLAGSANKVGANNFSQTGVDRVAGLYVSGAAGVLLAQAGRDMNLTAAQVSNAGSGPSALSAGNNLNLNTVTTASSQSLNWNANNRLSQTSSQDVGTQIQAGGALSLSAGQDLNAKAATVNAAGLLSVQAGNNVNLSAGQASQSLDVGCTEFCVNGAGISPWASCLRTEW